MRISEITEDISRRGFLGGLGAMAAGGAMAKPTALSKPLQHPHAAKPRPVDPHSTKVQPLVQAPKVDPGTARKILSAHAVNSGMTEPTELAQFLAQCAAETGFFKNLGEIGRPAKLAHKYAHSTGNQGREDALEYAGRGFIQLTGKGNYIAAGEGVHGDEAYYVEYPSRAAEPHEAAKIATWFWNKNVKPRVRNFADTAAVTKAINGRAAPQHEIQKRHQIFSQYYPAVKNWAAKRS
jgi:predicted chitinase